MSFGFNDLLILGVIVVPIALIALGKIKKMVGIVIIIAAIALFVMTNGFGFF